MNKYLKASECSRISEELTQEAEETELRIHSLFGTLENGFLRNDELTVLKGSMDFLLGTYFEQHMDLEVEMNSLLDDLKRGLLTQEELESLLRIDHYRSGLVSRMAGSLKCQLEGLFGKFTGILKTVYQGGSFPADQVNSLFTDMTFVIESVDFISKVVRTPAKQLNMSQIETDLRVQVDSALLRNHSVNTSSTNGSPTHMKSKRQMTLAETILDLANLTSDTPRSGTDRSYMSKATSGSTSSTVEGIAYTGKHDRRNNNNGTSRNHRNKRQHRMHNESYLEESNLPITIRMDGSTQTDFSSSELQTSSDFLPKIHTDHSNAASGSNGRPIGSKLFTAVNLIRKNSSMVLPGIPDNAHVDDISHELSSLSKKNSLSNVVSRMKIKSMKKANEMDLTSGSSKSRPGSRGDSGKLSHIRIKSKDNESNKSDKIRDKKRKSIIGHQTGKNGDAEDVNELVEQYDEHNDPNAVARNSSLTPHSARVRSRQASPMAVKCVSKNQGPASAMISPKRMNAETNPQAMLSPGQSTTGILTHSVNSTVMIMSTGSTPTHASSSATAIDVMKTLQSVNDMIRESAILQAKYPSDAAATINDILASSQAGVRSSLLTPSNDVSYVNNPQQRNGDLPINNELLSPTEMSQRALNMQNSNATTLNHHLHPNNVDVKVTSPRVVLEKKLGQRSITDEHSIHYPTSSMMTSSSHVSDSDHLIDSNNHSRSINQADSQHNVDHALKRSSHSSTSRSHGAPAHLQSNDHSQIPENIMSKVGGIIIEDDKVIFIDAQKFVSFDPHHQEEFLHQQITDGNYMSLEGYKEIIQDVKDGRIENITALSELSGSDKENLIQNARGYFTEKFHSPAGSHRTGRSWTSSLKGFGDELGVRTPGSRGRDESSSSKHNRSQAHRVADHVDSPMSDGSPTRGEGDQNDLNNQKLDRFAFPSMNSPGNSRSGKHGVYVNPDTRGNSRAHSSNNNGSDLLVIVAPSRREKVTDTSDFAEYLASTVQRSHPDASMMIAHHPDHIIKPPNTRTLSKIQIPAVDDESSILTDSISPSSQTGKGLFSRSPQRSKGSAMKAKSLTDMSIPAIHKQHQRQSVDMHVVQDITTSSNILATIYHHYERFLSDTDRVRLYQISIASTTIADTSQDMISKLFRKLLPQIDRLNAAATRAIITVQRAQAISSDLIVLICSGENGHNQFKGAAQEMYKLMGEVDVVKLWIDMQLLQYRSIFESFIALNLNSLPFMKDGNKEYQEVYDLFVSCQGMSVDMNNRIKSMKERCTRYGITSSVSSTLPTFNDSQSDNQHMLNSQQQQYLTFIQQTYFQALQNTDQPTVNALQQKVSELETMVEDLEDDKTELTKQAFQLQISKDQTPAAMMFYASLADQNLVPTFQQLLLQLNHLKKFTNADDHMDFMTVRRRLQVCLTAIPSIDRFLHKYDILHRTWLHHRFRVFSQRGLTGGNADSSHFCPICHTSSADMARLTSITTTTTTITTPLAHNPETLRAKSRLQSRAKSRAGMNMNVIANMNRPNTSFNPRSEDDNKNNISAVKFSHPILLKSITDYIGQDEDTIPMTMSLDRS